MSFGEPNDIEPVPRPAFAQARRRQQAIDQSLVRVGARIPRERLDFLRCRGQTAEVEVKPPDQRAAVGFRRRSEPLLNQPGRNKGIDGIASSVWRITRCVRHYA